MKYNKQHKNNCNILFSEKKFDEFVSWNKWIYDYITWEVTDLSDHKKFYSLNHRFIKMNISEFDYFKWLSDDYVGKFYRWCREWICYDTNEIDSRWLEDKRNTYQAQYNFTSSLKKRNIISKIKHRRYLNPNIGNCFNSSIWVGSKEDLLYKHFAKEQKKISTLNS